MEKHDMPFTNLTFILFEKDEKYIGEIHSGTNRIRWTEHRDELLVRAWLNAQWGALSRPRRLEIEPDAIYIIGSGGTSTIYRTQRSANGHVYAKRLDGGHFVYAPGAMRDLREHGRRITVEEAREYGARFGVCCRCGRTLTAEQSVSKGIGPVCEANL